MPSKKRLSCLGFVLVLAGCQGAPTYTPGFSLTALPAVESHAFDRNSGYVTIDFANVLSRRNRGLLATLADVESVKIWLYCSTDKTLEQAVPKAWLLNGTTGVTFAYVPPGKASYSVVAFNAAGRNIGWATGEVNILAGQTTSVDAKFPLFPTRLPVPVPSPSSLPSTAPTPGPGGGGTNATTNFEIGVELREGLLAKPLELVSAIKPPALDLFQVASDGSTGFWGTTAERLLHFDRDGHALAGDGLASVATKIEAVGNLGYVTVGVQPTTWATTYSRLTALGVETASGEVPAFTTNYTALGVGLDGIIWMATDKEIFRVDNVGGRTTFPTDMLTAEILGDDGAVYVSQSRIDEGGLESFVLRRYSAAGQLVWEKGPLVYPCSLTLDPQGNLWLIDADASYSKHYLVKFSSAGQQLAKIELPPVVGAPLTIGGSIPIGMVNNRDHLVFGPQGQIYVYYADDGMLLKLAPDGTFTDLYYAPDIIPWREFLSELYIPGDVEVSDVTADGQGNLAIVATSPRYQGRGMLLYKLP